MTDTNQATQSAKAPAPKTVAEDMDSRRIFTTTEDAANYLNLCAESFSDFDKIPLAHPGMSDEGVFDTSVYVPGMAVMVAKLMKVKTGSTPSQVKAIVVTPVPTLSFILSDATGTEWATKIIQKELNHVAVRALRDASDISTVVDQMPTTREAYMASGREGGSGIMETYNELFKGINQVMASKLPVWARAKLVKVELKRAMESKGYATEYYPALEERGEGKDSLFVTAINFGVLAAKAKGLDPAIFQKWLDTRNAKTFTASEAEDDEDDLDLSSMTDALMAEDKPATPAPAAA